MWWNWETRLIRQKNELTCRQTISLKTFSVGELDSHTSVDSISAASFNAVLNGNEMFGSLQFLAFLNLQLFLNTSLSICPFPINLEWRKGLCGTKVRLGKRWGWLGMWESVVLCIHMVSDCWIPQLLTHLSLPGKCGIVLNVRQSSDSWQLHLVLAVCSLQSDGGASSSCSSPFSFLSPSAGHLSHCTVYNTLILELVSCCFHQFLPVFNSEPCVQSSTSAEIIQTPGRDFFL